MDKKVIIVICIIILLILGGTYIIWQNNNPQIHDTEIKEAYTDKVRVSSNTTTVNNDKYDVMAIIPSVSNVGADLANYLNAKINDDLSYMNVYNEAVIGRTENEDKFTYKTNFERYDSDIYVSIVCTQEFQLGRERRVERKKCYVIDSMHNRSVTLQDIFKDKVNYEKYILEAINKEASNKSIELIGGNGLDKLPLTQSFYIKDKSLYISFEPGQIAPVSSGQIEIKMPFTMQPDHLYTK